MAVPEAQEAERLENGQQRDKDRDHQPQQEIVQNGLATVEAELLDRVGSRRRQKDRNRRPSAR